MRLRPKIVTPVQRKYRTRIRQGVEKGWGVLRDGREQNHPGPNFAGNTPKRIRKSGFRGRKMRALHACVQLTLDAESINQSSECRRLLPSARVIKEESGERLTPILQNADELPAFELRLYALV